MDPSRGFRAKVDVHVFFIDGPNDMWVVLNLDLPFYVHLSGLIIKSKAVLYVSTELSGLIKTIL